MRTLGEAQRRYQGELNEKARLQAELARALTDREALGKTPALSVDFLLADQFITGGKHRIMRQEQAIFRAQKGVEKCLRAYLMARKQTRMIEVLREKDYEEFKRERARREQKVIDELVVARHGADTAISAD